MWLSCFFCSRDHGIEQYDEWNGMGYVVCVCGSASMEKGFMAGFLTKQRYTKLGWFGWLAVCLMYLSRYLSYLLPG